MRIRERLLGTLFMVMELPFLFVYVVVVILECC